MDLLDLWRGGLSLRRLSVLVDALPSESATISALVGIPSGWTNTALLVADLFHAIAGEAHPSRPTPKSTAGSSRYARLRSALEAQRARRIAEGATPTTAAE